MEDTMIAVVRSLYTDVFDTGNCPAVNNHYHDDAVCHFNGKDLSVESLKSSMRDFVAAHSDIRTTIESVFASGDRTFARLVRDVTEKESGRSRRINIMVEKRFVGDKVKELWFMVDDDQYRNTWAR
ncbi:ester cyclase [Burkholderia sp. MS455]|uniref:SnoaL-like polyketide cyclase n=1 Tax=Burkholderia pyrrocinia TaxID=60550 RepID=A0A318J0T6_BURPY|nr:MULTISPECIES: ester cyclase [Burkholderia]MDR6500647.1 hypothetical protein [Burkholderia ambifaria]PXX41205.1 SnoaL-like polyketide cyclase [Burkholderia pyrrocinia]QRR07269.1 ester cyclase [Burkholderia sp. MS455]SFW59246.1 SnoaL-like polyketide cyclase [Burkholderia sp. NFACC33-1]SFY13807.1 SnoaL-like polyketide cyclase [Burkholderia sp. NFPP32]